MMVVVPTDVVVAVVTRPFASIVATAVLDELQVTDWLKSVVGVEEELR